MEKLTTDNQPQVPSTKTREAKGVIGTLFNLFIIVVFAMISFVVVDVSFDFDWKNGGYEILLLIVASYSVFSSSYSTGKAKGSLTKKYTTAEAECADEVKGLIAHKNIEHLSEFCEETAVKELRIRRSSTLGAICMTYETWERDYSHKTMREIKAMTKTAKDKHGNEVQVPMYDWGQLRVLYRVKNMTMRRFEPDMLTAPVNVKAHDFIPDYRRPERLSKLRKLVTTLITSLVAVNFSVSLIQDFGFATVVECAVKIFPLALSWLNGQRGGYANATEDRVDYYTNKAKWCKRAKAWLDSYAQNPVAKVSSEVSIAE